MIDELLIRQEAQSRGIEVTEEEVNAAIGERYSYYDGGLPTPVPTGTNTPVPTPSLTPIPTVVTSTTGITFYDRYYGSRYAGTDTDSYGWPYQYPLTYFDPSLVRGV